MAKYMRNHFSFFGIKIADRRHIFKTIWKENQQEVAENPREIALGITRIYQNKSRSSKKLCGQHQFKKIK
jgi:3-methyladenine DNA glycosylase AlkD